MDWLHILFFVFPIATLSILYMLLSKRLTEYKISSLRLLTIIESLHDRMALIEANQKIFYALHKRDS